MCDSIHPRPGRIVAGKYQLEQLIGEGAMGTVWRATHLNLNQRVAVKLILPELADSEAARSRFDAEAKASAALHSRFVVQIYDSGITDDGVPYIVMEYLVGEPLESRVERQGPLPLEQAVQYIGQVARGLARAHAQGIVHRDLKPANVFITQSEDGEEVAKILDFGIAKIQRSAPAVSSTATGAVVGTPLFMSPEQARGSRSVDHRADIYSLGMVTFWALTGRYAFAGEALGELIIAICTHPLPSLAATMPGLPLALDQWFFQACARDPAARFASADALVDALVEAAQVNPNVLLASGVIQRGWGDGRASVATPSALMPAFGQQSSMGGMAGTIAVGATGAGVVQATQPPRRRGIPWGWLVAIGMVLGLVTVAVLVVGGLSAGLLAASSPPAEPARNVLPAVPPPSVALVSPDIAPASTPLAIAPPSVSASAAGTETDSEAPPPAPPPTPLRGGQGAGAAHAPAPIAAASAAKPSEPAAPPSRPAAVDIGF
ncbi:MAG: serine/threonine protein kinase [Polyangiaceae bacterium]|nr:serine/threonine protein kinase [Polyangiaceae bacterium]